ncbi:MAG: cold shock and DUF1294 domain-containing protein [Phormidesmis sp.]
MSPGLKRGQLTHWNDERGFGFVQPASGGKDVFLHVSALKEMTRRPQVGDTVYYRVIADGKKFRAQNAFISGARGQSTSPHQPHSNNLKWQLLTLQVLLLSTIPIMGSIYHAWQTHNPLPLILYIVMSFATFWLYADDKSHAKQGRWRTHEKTLHLCELAGGWIGGYIAQQKLRHKSRKPAYQLAFWIIVVAHQIGWIGWLVMGQI